jgi:hypothetical protein
MDTLSEYRRIVKDLIREYARYEPSVGDIRTEVIFDEANDHYELIHVGWAGSSRICGAVLHIDIRDGLVWIEHNGTEDPIGSMLVEAGIPRDKIVLGFQPPDARHLTGFATA